MVGHEVGSVFGPGAGLVSCGLRGWITGPGQGWVTGHGAGSVLGHGAWSRGGGAHGRPLCTAAQSQGQSLGGIS